jgi:hypothetical protein
MKFKIGDKVRFKDPESPNAKYFDEGLSNLEVKADNLDNSRLLRVWESDKSQWYFVDEDELELMEPRHDFMWAVEQMKQGKKVRRNHWQNWEGFALHNADGIGLMFTNNRYMSDKISISDIEATDWEIFEEEITWEEITKKIRNQLEVSPESPTTIRLNSKVIKILENQILRHTSRGGDKITRIFNMFLIEDDTLKDSEFLLSDEERCKECGHLK